ncbi:MAG: ATP-binding protein [Candidatus Eremiobacteraeota bacterium]|nr:ATP-binding protein [Candidatus Eremiobacteraeota bacterium]
MSTFRAAYPSAANSARDARRALVAFAQTAGFDGPELQELELAIGEALANAVEHGHAFGGSVEVSASFSSEVITIEIKDNGSGFKAWEDPAARPRAASSPRGFGIHIMRATVDHVRFLDGGTRVVLTKRAGVGTVASDRREA